MGVNGLSRPDCVIIPVRVMVERMAAGAPVTVFSLRQVLRGGQGEWHGHLPRV